MIETRSIEAYCESVPEDGLARHLRPRPSRRLIGLLLVVALTNGIAGIQAQAQGSSEYSVKAAFIYNFAKFVEWPSEALGDDGAPLIVGVLGQDPFGNALDQAIAGKTVNGRPLVIQRLTWGQGLRGCHILFISQSERKHMAQILSSLQGTNILTISDMVPANQPGGIINFVIDQNKVRFEINAGAADQARLKISSRLLTLAKAVRGGA